MRIPNATATGMAMIINVQKIHAVLCMRSSRDSSKQYTGIGAAMETAAIRETVMGKPMDCGHLAFHVNRPRGVRS
jgi:hypothetical protein